MARKPRKANAPAVKPIIKDAEAYIREARYLARSVFSYYGPALGALTIRVKDTIVSGGMPTFAVDKYMRMYAHPEAVTRWMEAAENVSKENPCKTCGAHSHGKLAYVAGVLIHEMWHPMRKHHIRWKKIPNFVTQIGQIAADYEINDDLILSFKMAKQQGDGDICLPPGGLHPSQRNFPEELLMEEYYKLLLDSTDLEDVTCGSGAGGDAEGWEDGPPSDGDEEDSPGLDEGELDLLERQVAEEIKKQASKNPGKIPAGFLRWSGGVIGVSKYDWKTELGKLIAYNMSRYTQGYDLTTYRRLSVLSTSLNYQVILPTYKKPLPTVALVYDTSGSVQEHALKEAVEHGEAICKAQQATINVVSCDMEVSVDTAHGTMSAVKLTGGGGTDMTVGINKALELNPKPDVIVLFTDGFTPWPTEPLNRCALIVCLVGDHVCDVNNIPSWAQLVYVKD